MFNYNNSIYARHPFLVIVVYNIISHYICLTLIPIFSYCLYNIFINLSDWIPNASFVIFFYNIYRFSLLIIIALIFISSFYRGIFFSDWDKLEYKFNRIHIAVIKRLFDKKMFCFSLVLYFILFYFITFFVLIFITKKSDLIEIFVECKYFGECNHKLGLRNFLNSDNLFFPFSGESFFIILVTFIGILISVCCSNFIRCIIFPMQYFIWRIKGVNKDFIISVV
jgi:hypothetical protein